MSGMSAAMAVPDASAKPTEEVIKSFFIDTKKNETRWPQPPGLGLIKKGEGVRKLPNDQ